jgi:hypothetical protein
MAEATKKKGGKKSSKKVEADAPAKTPDGAPVATVETKVKAKKAAKPVSFPNGKAIPNGTKVVSCRYMDYRAQGEVIDGKIVFQSEGYKTLQAAAMAMNAAIRSFLKVEEDPTNKRGVTGARHICPLDVAENADIRAFAHQAAQSGTEGVSWVEGEALIHDPAPVSERKPGSGNGRGRPLDLSGKTDAEIAEYRASVEKQIEALQKRIAKIDAETESRAGQTA